jgi:hypothetical protein
MKLPEIYDLCRQVIVDPQNERFVQIFKEGKTGPLIGAAAKKSKEAKPAVIAEVMGILVANPDAQPAPDWEEQERKAAAEKAEREKEELAKRLVEAYEERLEREGFRRGALFAYENVMHILEVDRDVRTSHNWPMGEMYETLWSNVFIHVNPAIKAFKK